MRFVLAMIATLALARAAAAGGGGIAVPPVELDLGVGIPVGQLDTLLPSTEVLAGLHWASLAWRPTRFDFGVGYVGSFRVVREEPMPFSTRPSANGSIIMNGGYLSLATTLITRKHWRTWFVTRGELLRASDGKRDMSALGGSVRVTTELFSRLGAGIDRTGFVVGTMAFGVYLEATYRDVPTEFGALGVTSGVTCKLPLFGIVW